MTLKLRNLSCGYQSLPDPVIQSVETELLAGDFVCLVGRNGIGKSTLMRTIAGLQPALSGAVYIQDKMVSKLSASERAKHIAVVTTEKVSSPGLVVDDVLALGRLPYTNWQNQLSDQDIEIINATRHLTQITEFTGLPLNSLLDGQRQRVMIARAMIQTPQIMVLDEITAFLDLPSRVEVMAMLRNYAREHGCIVLLSSHDLDLSLELADKIWLLTEKKLHDGTPESIINAGHISQAFSSKDIVFDSQQKRFKFRKEE